MRILLLFLFVSQISLAQDWVTVVAKKGDTRILLLKKYNLTDQCSKEQYLSLNKVKADDFMVLGKKYKLPIQSYKYNGTSIRSTIKITDYDQAKAIEEWNLNIVKKGVKSKSYKSGSSLWVPYYLKKCFSKYGHSTASKPAASSNQSGEKIGSTVTHKIFGKNHQNIKIVSNKLKGRIYYLVSGHGGPDPGAMGKCQGKDICEDEYAYDVTLRLAKKLIENGATVYMITRDENDGIRDYGLLKCDRDEVCYPKLKMPVNQKKRLRQRVKAVNKLYLKHKKQGSKYQRMIVIHVDSRRSKDRVDMFFYHHKRSKVGKKLANGMYGAVKAQYAKHQKGRGYKGTVKARNLHMLREAKPTGVYIELGNIQNKQDQKRFTIVDNRDAIAKWFAGALME